MTVSRGILLAAAVAVLALAAMTGAAQDEPDKKARQRASEFLAALGKGDVKAMKEHYAPQVLVKAGSELLQTKWGLSPAGRGQDLVLGRDELLSGYAKLIAATGNKWTEVWARVLKDKSRITFTMATDADKPFGGIRKGDLVVRVVPGPSDDTFRYVLRPDPQGQWRVVIEAADY